MPADKRACPLCGARPDGMAFPYSTVWRHREYCYVRCSDCRCTFVDPAPSPPELAEMYSRENYHDVHYCEVHAEERYRRSARLLRRMSGGRKTMLDFGCGTGTFMLAARDEGFSVVGVEYETTAVESAARNTGLPVTTLAEVKATGTRFEIIHIGDVLEHLPAPMETMRELCGSLAPGGIFFVEGPLQSNPSLVYYVSRAFKGLRRMLGIDAPSRVAPTHLILATGSAQRRFFTDALGLRCTHFAVTESGWPYCLEVPTPRTPSALVRAAIGTVAILISRVFREWGNRFTAVLETEHTVR